MRADKPVVIPGIWPLLRQLTLTFRINRQKLSDLLSMWSSWWRDGGGEAGRWKWQRIQDDQLMLTFTWFIKTTITKLSISWQLETKIRIDSALCQFWWHEPVTFWPPNSLWTDLWRTPSFESETHTHTHTQKKRKKTIIDWKENMEKWWLEKYESWELTMRRASFAYTTIYEPFLWYPTAAVAGCETCFHRAPVDGSRSRNSQ